VILLDELESDIPVPALRTTGVEDGLPLKIFQSAEERTPVTEPVDVARLNVNLPLPEPVIDNAGPEVANS